MSEPGTRTKYTYDYNGNTTGKTDSTGTTSYSWDYENREPHDIGRRTIFLVVLDGTPSDGRLEGKPYSDKLPSIHE